jgi:hypothetical protein
VCKSKAFRYFAAGVGSRGVPSLVVAAGRDDDDNDNKGLSGEFLSKGGALKRRGKRTNKHPNTIKQNARFKQ